MKDDPPGCTWTLLTVRFLMLPFLRMLWMTEPKKGRFLLVLVSSSPPSVTSCAGRCSEVEVQ